MQKKNNVINSGVARIFPVGEHWGGGPWIFVGGTNNLSWPPPPPPKKKTSSFSGGTSWQAKKKEKKKVITFVGGGGGPGRNSHLQRHQNSQKAYFKAILRIHKHDFCGGAKYYARAILANKKIYTHDFFCGGGTENLWGHVPPRPPRSYAPGYQLILLCICFKDVKTPVSHLHHIALQRL